MKSHLSRRARPWLVSLMLAGAADLMAGGVDVGQPAPDCRLSDPEGGGADNLSKYRGKVLYVDFWASWCGPCAQSFPFMNALHKDLHARGLEIIGVDLDEEPAEARAFLTRTPARFTIRADASGECPQRFGVQAMPSSYLVDKSGIIRKVHLGFKPGEAAELRRQVEALLDAPAAKPR